MTCPDCLGRFLVCTSVIGEGAVTIEIECTDCGAMWSTCVELCEFTRERQGNPAVKEIDQEQWKAHVVRLGDSVDSERKKVCLLIAHSARKDAEIIALQQQIAELIDEGEGRVIELTDRIAELEKEAQEASACIRGWRDGCGPNDPGWYDLMRKIGELEEIIRTRK